MLAPQTLQPLRLQVEALMPQPQLEATLSRHLRVTPDEAEESLIGVYLRAAILWAEAAMHRTVVERDHEWVLADFPRTSDQAIHLPRGKTQAVKSIQYLSSGDVIELRGPSSGVSVEDVNFYEDLRGDEGGTLVPLAGKVWPTVTPGYPDPVVIAFTAGWSANEIPADILHAILFAVTDAYELRGTGDLNGGGRNLQAREALIGAHRLERFY